MRPLTIDGPGAFQKHFGVSSQTLDKLKAYEDLLKRWQRKINLVAPSTLGDVWHRHFADSAQLLAMAPEGARKWVDLGSGAGFPGLVLAILRAGRGGENDAEPVTLIESDQRKAAFLGEIARQVSVPVDIAVMRIELSSTQGRYTSVDVVTARALAPLDRLLGLSAPLFGSGTVGLFLKGREASGEVAAARQAWEFDCDLVGSVTDAEARIAVISGPPRCLS